MNIRMLETREVCDPRTGWRTLRLGGAYALPHMLAARLIRSGVAIFLSLHT